MSTRLDHVLNGLKEKGRKGLIIYLTAGMPDAEGTIDAVRRAEEAGADVIELGLPFSDPMADGPVIQTASVAALKGGMTLAKVREIVQAIRRFSEMPLVGMGYVNNMLHYGFPVSLRISRRRAWTASSSPMCRTRSRAKCAKFARRTIFP